MSRVPLVIVLMSALAFAACGDKAGDTGPTDADDGAADSGDPGTDATDTDTVDTDTDTDTDTTVVEDADGDGAPADVDCDDTDPTVFPGAPDICNAVDDDCDPSTPDAGVAHQDAAGVWQDLSSTFDGATEGSPVALRVGEGTVHLCEGTWFGTWEVEGGSVAFTGHGVREAVVLDGGGSGTVVAVAAEGAVVEIEGVTLRGGAADRLDGFLDRYLGGGAVACIDGASLVVRDSVLQDNEADVGGGVYGYRCSVGLEGVRVADNQAEWGGGIYVVEGDLSLSGVELVGNQAGTAGGAVGLEPYGVDGVGLSLVESALQDNLAVFGGGLALFDAVDASCVDSVLHRNIADDAGGAVYLGATGALLPEFSSTHCDFGVDDEDNLPQDLYRDTGEDTGGGWAFGEDQSFVCADTGCG